MFISILLWSIRLSIFLLLTGCRLYPDSELSTETNPSLPIPYPLHTPVITPVIETTTGHLQNQVMHLNENMPRAESGEYVPPTRAEQAAFVELISFLESGDVVPAATLAQENQYTLVHYVDRNDDNATSYLLKEMLPITRGWGLYVLREDPGNGIIVEAPHPLADRGSDRVALDIYQALDARALLIAGADRDANRRDAADVAHAPESIFQSIHKTLLAGPRAASDVAVILQIHGFASEKHPGYPPVVLGFGVSPSEQAVSLGTEIVDALSLQGIPAGLCGKGVWSDLCGTKNVQGAASGQAIFIHLELSKALREKDGALVDALKQVLLK